MSGSDWFAYTANNPMSYVDPTGLYSSDFYEAISQASPEEQAELSRQYQEIAEETDPAAVRDVVDQAVGKAAEATAEAHRANLEEAQNLARENPRYKPGAGGPYNLPGKGKTWCNQATYDICEATGVNLNLLTGGLWRMNAGANWATKFMERMNDPKMNWQSVFGSLEQLSDLEAQAKANEGRTVIAAWFDKKGMSHMATVRPDDLPFDSSLGPRISNVGAVVGVMYALQAFGRAESLSDVKYYHDPAQTFTYRRSEVDWWQEDRK